jgi:hypothetical protein
MSVPAFEQSLHLPRFDVLQDLRCGPAAAGSTATTIPVQFLGRLSDLANISVSASLAPF